MLHNLHLNLYKCKHKITTFKPSESHSQLIFPQYLHIYRNKIGSTLFAMRKHSMQHAINSVAIRKESKH